VEKDKKLNLEQLIAQLEVDANNAEDDQVATALAKVEKAHQELSGIDLPKYGRECRQSLSSWSAFFNPSLIRNADYVRSNFFYIYILFFIFLLLHFFCFFFVT